MTKNYDELISQATLTLADNTNKDISPADQRLMHTDTLDAHNNGTLIVRVEQGTVLPVASKAGRLFYRTDENILYADTGTTWNKVGGGINSWDEDADGNIVPLVPNVGIGSITNSVRQMVLGDLGLPEGGLASDHDHPHGLGGVVLIGIRDLAARQGNPAVAEADSPVALEGNVILLDGSIYCETPDDIDEDRYAIFHQSVSTPDGRKWTELSIGPAVQYGTTDEVTDNTLVPCPNGVETTVLELTTTNAYAIGETVAVQMRIEETSTGNRTATGEVRVYIDGVLDFVDPLSVSGSQVQFGRSFANDQVINIGSVVSLRWFYTGNQADCQIRGDVSPTLIRVTSLL